VEEADGPDDGAEVGVPAVAVSVSEPVTMEHPVSRTAATSAATGTAGSRLRFIRQDCSSGPGYDSPRAGDDTKPGDFSAGPGR
jgi:hypothetical protein